MSDRRINWKAVVMGALTDIAGTFAFASLVGILAAVATDMYHLSTSEMEARLQSPSSILAMIIIGLAFTVLGGYVAGRVSSTHEVIHGLIVGAISLLIGLASFGSLPLWYDIVSLVVVIPCGMLGGWIAVKNRQRSQQVR